MTFQERLPAPAYRYAGHLVLGPPEPAPLRILNPPAAVIWRGLVTGLDREAIAGQVETAFGLTGEAARAHVDSAASTWWPECLAAPPDPDPPRSPALPARLWTRWRQRTYALCGRPILVRFANRDLESLVHPRFAHAEVASAPASPRMSLSAVRGGFLLAEPGRPPIRVAGREALLGVFVRRFVEISHPEAEWIAVLHAAAVADPEGRGILLAGGNGSGKSTLVAGLLAAGYGYLSDDCAPIERGGRIVPVPFGICLKDGSWPVAGGLLEGFDAAPIHRDDAGRRGRYVPPPPLPLRPVRPRELVFPRYRAGARPSRQEIDPVAALQRLVAGRAWLSRRPEHLRASLDLLARTPAWEVEFGTLAEAVALLRGL